MLEIRREAGALDGTQWHAAGAPSGYMTDPVSDAALTGAAFVRHLGDARFASLRALRDALNAAGFGLDTLSMGMSADLEAAIAEGATLVRVGTAIFGARDPAPPIHSTEAHR